MSFIRSFATLAVAAVAGSASAQTFTFATFADPSSGPVPPMFVYDNSGPGTLNAAWGQPGLTLQTPGSAAPDYSNVTFAMSTLVQTSALPFATFTGGNIQFFDSSSTMIFRIDFSSAYLSGPLGFGAADLIGNNVVFSGPLVGSPLSQESFSFSFANQVATANGYTATAAFTSSAAPTPGALALVGISGLVAARRRRA